METHSRYTPDARSIVIARRAFWGGELLRAKGLYDRERERTAEDFVNRYDSLIEQIVKLSD